MGGAPVLERRDPAQNWAQNSAQKPVPTRFAALGSSLVAELPGMLLFAGVAMLGAAVALGSRNPILIVAAPIGGMGLAFAARRPLLAVVMMVVIEVTNISGVLAPKGGIPFFQASVLLGICAVAFALRDPVARARLNAWTLICGGLLAVYVATQLVATIGTVDMAASIDGMRRLILDCVFIMLVLMLIQLTAQPWTVAAAIVVPLAVLSLLCVINQFVFGGTQSFGGFSTVTTASGEMITTLRYGGPLPDSNFWGRHLVMGLPLAAALLTKALRERQRLAVAVWITCTLSILIGVYLTQSRGTFLAAAAAIVAWFIGSEKSVRRKGLAYAPLALLAFMVPGVGNRLIAAVSDVKDASANGNVDPSVLGRLSAQQEAWAMFGERPIFGWGPVSFPGQVVNFAGRVPIAVREPTNAPHNLYAEFAAESGINGLLGWAVVVFGFLTITILGIVAHPKSRDRILAAAVIGAIIAWSAASIGLHMSYFRTLGVVLALVAGVAPEWPVSTETVRSFLRGVVIWATAAAVGATAAFLCLWAGSSSTYIATQRVTLMPIGPRDGDFAYALDIRSRIELLPTFAALLDDPQSDVDLSADAVRGVLTFEATESSPDAARDHVQLAVAYAESQMHSSIGYQQYSLVTVGSMTIEDTKERSGLALLLAVAVGGGITVGGGMWLSKRSRDNLVAGKHRRQRKWGPKKSGPRKSGPREREFVSV